MEEGIIDKKDDSKEKMMREKRLNDPMTCSIPGILQLLEIAP